MKICVTLEKKYAQPPGGLKFGERNYRGASLRGSSANPSAIVRGPCGRCGRVAGVSRLAAVAGVPCVACVSRVVVVVVWPVLLLCGRPASCVACVSRVVAVVVWPVWPMSAVWPPRPVWLLGGRSVSCVACVSRVSVFSCGPFTFPNSLGFLPPYELLLKEILIRW